jgi:hypothetical protein
MLSWMMVRSSQMVDRNGFCFATSRGIDRRRRRRVCEQRVVWGNIYHLIAIERRQSVGETKRDDD